SIGEPGTQLTLRTFHIGGTASVTVEGWYQASFEGIVQFRNLRTIDHSDGAKVVVNRAGSMVIMGEGQVVLQTLPSIPYGARVLVQEGAQIKRGDRIVEWDPHFTPIIAEMPGTIKLVDIMAGVT